MDQLLYAFFRVPRLDIERNLLARGVRGVIGGDLDEDLETSCVEWKKKRRNEDLHWRKLWGT